ncbi:MAG: hypothetical protein B6I28_06190 [Fusobacteriia bacterium 4572_132]|nr:MAG: hypothetical protein B6I28_06190 [Fusobacteriia bacterium 4572_132]
MEIYIDEEQLGFELGKKDTLNSIIKTIKEYLWEQKKAVIEIRINDENIDDIKSLNLSEIKRINFETRKTEVLLLESLQEVNIYIDKLKLGIESILNYLSNNNEKEAMELIIQAINGLEWIYDILDSVEKLAAVKYNEKSFGDVFLKYENILSEILDSLENKDFIMLSDLLEFEIGDIMDEIKEKLPEVYDFILTEEKKRV